MSRRLPAIVLLAAAIAAAFVVEGGDSDAPVAAGPPVVQPGYATPVAAPADALSSTWYCAAGTADKDGLAGHRVLIANPTDQEVHGVLTVFGGAIQGRPAGLDASGSTTTTAPSTTQSTAAATPEPVTQPITVPPRSRIAFRLGDIVQSQLASALVEVDHGEVAVEHVLVGSLGYAAAPCATTTAAEWTVPWGVTTKDARELLVLFNPYPGDATLDIAFATEAGTREPVPYQGFVVPGRSVVAFDVSEPGVADRNEQVTARVMSRSGRVVVDRIQSFDGTNGTKGMAVGLGAPAPAETWIFPDGGTGEGLREQVVVHNPTDRPAEVDVEVRLDKPEENGTPEPFELTIAPRRTAVVDLSAEERVPKGISHAIVVHSLNDVAVIAERALRATRPSSRRGVTTTLGSPLAGPRWVLAAGSTSSLSDEWLIILNPSSETPAKVSVQALAKGQLLAVQDLQDLNVAPAARLALRLGDHIERDELSLLVTSDQPIVVERGIYAVGSIGMANNIGIPMSEGLIVPTPAATG